jgi:hypothetical protein
MQINQHNVPLLSSTLKYLKVIISLKLEKNENRKFKEKEKEDRNIYQYTINRGRRSTLKQNQTVITENSDCENQLKLPTIIRAYQEYTNNSVKTKPKYFFSYSRDNIKDSNSFEFLKSVRTIDRKPKVFVNNKMSSCKQNHINIKLPDEEITKFFFNGKYFHIKSRNIAL